MSKQGADLVALWISWDDKPEDAKLGLLTYPPAVANGPNYGIVHNDEPFDGGVTIPKVLSSSCVIAYVPRSRYATDGAVPVRLYSFSATMLILVQRDHKKHIFPRVCSQGRSHYDR